MMRHIEQTLRANVSDFTMLRLKSRFRIASHSLGGGGYQGSEYPVLIRVDYQYADGETFRVFGYYTQNARGNRTDNGQQVPANEWQPLDLDVLSLDPRPLVITRVRVSAICWDY
jgi:hypothetical protein